jgi:cystathionine beta-lyase/cystathionine gamma-synthase
MMYGRYGSATRNTLEQTLAKLEKAKFAMVFSSGNIVMKYLSNSI